MEWLAFIVLMAIGYGILTLMEKGINFLDDKTEQTYKNYRRQKEKEAEQISQSDKRMKL